VCYMAVFLGTRHASSLQTPLAVMLALTSIARCHRHSGANFVFMLVAAVAGYPVLALHKTQPLSDSLATLDSTGTNTSCPSPFR
jgi:hypothetical protein